MSKLLTVLSQEYQLKVRTKAFIIGTILFPLLMGVMVVLPSVFMGMNIEKPTTLAVIDESGVVREPLARVLSAKTKDGRLLYSLQEEKSAGRSRDQVALDLGREVTADRIGGFFILPADILQGGQASFYAKNVSDFRRNQTLENALQKAVRELRVRDSGLDTALVAGVVRDVPLTTFKVKEGGGASKDKGATFGLAYIVGLIFYITMIMYGAMTLRACLEEKTSRSAEAMVSMVRPTTLMGGKILGIGLTGLTQLVIWGAVIAVASAFATASSPAFLSGLDLSAIKITLPMAAFFLVFFILGFLLYAGLSAALGAMVNSEAEAQQLQMFINLPAILSMMLMFMAIRDPGSTFIRVCSMIPFFAPVVMTVRICVVMPPLWELLLSSAILAVSIAGVIWVAGRIFRVGLLMYGKRPDFPELMKWIRYG
jgi:ABC-2 type transport system permease protein